MINREDMLELTRRMTPGRHCFDRLAGCYLDDEGYIDGSFHIHFLKLSQKEMKYNLELAKTIPFSATNQELKAYPFPGKKEESRQLQRLLDALNGCGLKNDEWMETLYEILSDQLHMDGQYAIYVFHGVYDVPIKASDKVRLDESEEVYSFLVCTIAPWSGEYQVEKPEYGFLYPAFTDRSSDPSHILVYGRQEDANYKLLVEKVIGQDLRK